MYPTFRILNRKISLWATRKFKKSAHYRRRAEHRLGVIATSQSNLCSALEAWCKTYKWLYGRSWRRHPKKGSRWRQEKYCCRDGLWSWEFFANAKNRFGIVTQLRLLKMTDLPIKLHLKIRAEATPYDPVYQQYFEQRTQARKGNAGWPDQFSPWSLKGLSMCTETGTHGS